MAGAASVTPALYALAVGDVALGGRRGVSLRQLWAGLSRNHGRDLAADVKRYLLIKFIKDERLLVLARDGVTPVGDAAAADGEWGEKSRLRAPVGTPPRWRALASRTALHAHTPRSTRTLTSHALAPAAAHSVRACEELRLAAVGVPAGAAPLADVQRDMLEAVAEARHEGLPLPELRQRTGLQLPQVHFRVNMLIAR